MTDQAPLPLSNGRFDRHARAAFIRLLAQGHSRTNAARALGFGRRTITRRVDQDPEFAQACMEAEGEVLDEIEVAIIDKARKGHVEAGKFVLERRDPLRWGPLSARQAVVAPALADASVEELTAVAADLIREIIAKEKRTAEAEVIDVESTEVDSPVPPVPQALAGQSDILGDVDWDAALG